MGSVLLKKILVFLSTFLIVVILSALVVLYLAPGIALSYVSDWYEEQGEGYTLTVKDWKFSPFTTHLTLTGVTLNHPEVGQNKLGQETTHLDQLVIDLNIWALLQQKIEVHNLVLEGVDLALEALLTDANESINIAGLTIPLASENTDKQSQEQATEVDSDEVQVDKPNAEAKREEKTEAEVNAEVDTEELQPWTVQINKLEIKNQQYQWQIKLDDLNTSGSAHIKKIQLTGLDTAVNSHPQLNIELELQALAVTGAQNLKLNNPLSLTMKGRLNNLQTQPQWQGEFSLKDLSLSLEEEMTVGFEQLSLKNLLADAHTQSIERFLIQRSEEHTSELQSRPHLVCRLLLEKKKQTKKAIGQRHFDVQLVGGMVLHEGRIAEMQTGEGNTLVAPLEDYLNALVGVGGNVVTVD